jgi:ribose-phosphate pyrophosphokinase
MDIHIRQQDSSFINYKVLGFAGGESHIQLAAATIAKDEVLTIRAGLTSSNDVMDLLLIENALRHAFGQTIKINVELPYLPYARQDRVCAEGQAFSLEVMAKVLMLMSINELVTWDCHSKVGVELTGAITVTPAVIIQSDAALGDLLKQPESVLVCPDKGAVARCQDIQKLLV